MSASTSLTAEDFSRMVQELVTGGGLGFVEAVYRITDELTEQEFTRSRKEMACSKGCRLCCCQMVTAADDEWLVIETYLFTMSFEVKEKLYKRTTDLIPLWTKWWEERSDESRGHPDVLYRDWTGIPCIFLNEESICDIYPVRPIDCRRVSSPVPCQSLSQLGAQGFTFPWHHWALQMLNEHHVQEYHRESSTPLIEWMRQLIEHAQAYVSARQNSLAYQAFEQMVRALAQAENLTFARAVYSLHDQLRQEAQARASMLFACQRGCNRCCYQLVCLSPMAWKEVEGAIAKLPAEARKKLEKRSRQALPRWQQYAKRHGNLLSKDPVRAHRDWDGTPCPFLNEKGFCDVYEARPFTCRSYANTKRCTSAHQKGATQFHYPFDTWANMLLHTEQGKFTTERDVSPVYEWLRLKYRTRDGKRLRMYVFPTPEAAQAALAKHHQR